MHELVLAAGVDPARVFRIPLGIDLEHFPLGDLQGRAAARAALGLPEVAFVVGSFQKDGVGWGEGLEPKLVKGPDVLVAVAARVQEQVSELHVLLTGPARGYVQRELDRAGVPWTHVYARSRDELRRAYHALDAYLVSSRQEGGPKAVLEALAAGVPLVATRVGQVAELAGDGVSALLCDVEDVDALSAALLRLYEDSAIRASLVARGREIAESHALELQDSLWAPVLEGFVERAD
jgi:glycosyltransferase involved in cell wall biosynthesis